jgi:hypothetical protein
MLNQQVLQSLDYTAIKKDINENIMVPEQDSIDQMT